MGCERNKGVKPRFLGLAGGRWGRPQEEWMWGKDQEFGLDILGRRCVWGLQGVMCQVHAAGFASPEFKREVGESLQRINTQPRMSAYLSKDTDHVL